MNTDEPKAFVPRADSSEIEFQIHKLYNEFLNEEIGIGLFLVMMTELCNYYSGVTMGAEIVRRPDSKS